MKQHPRRIDYKNLHAGIRLSIIETYLTLKQAVNVTPIQFDDIQNYQPNKFKI